MKEGIFNDTQPHNNELYFNCWLKNKTSFDYDVFSRTKIINTDKLNYSERRNEISAYYERFDKFISMPHEIANRVYQLMKQDLKDKGIVK